MNGQARKALVVCNDVFRNITGIEVISRKCWLIHTCDINFPKAIVCLGCTLQSSVHVDSKGEVWPVPVVFLFLFFLSLQCNSLAFLAFGLSQILWIPVFFPLLNRSWYFPRERAPTDPASSLLSQVILPARHLFPRSLRLLGRPLHSLMVKLQHEIVAGLGWAVGETETTKRDRAAMSDTSLQERSSQPFQCSLSSSVTPIRW